MIDIQHLLDLIEENDLPTLMLFYSGGCGPCAKIKPIYEKWAYNNRTKAICFSFNILNTKNLAAHFKAIVMPTLIYSNNKGIIKRLICPRTEEDLESLLC